MAYSASVLETIPGRVMMPLVEASPLTGTVTWRPLTVMVTRSASVNFLSLFRSNGEYCSCAPVIASISISQLRPP